MVVVMKIVLRSVAGVVSLLTILVCDQVWFESLPKTVKEAAGAESDHTILALLTIVLSTVGALFGVLIAHRLSGKWLRLKVISLVVAAVVVVGLALATTVTRDRWSAMYLDERVWTGIWFKEGVREAHPTFDHADFVIEYTGHVDQVWPPNSRLLASLIPSTAFCFLLASIVFTLVLAAELRATGTAPVPSRDKPEDDAD